MRTHLLTNDDWCLNKFTLITTYVLKMTQQTVAGPSTGRTNNSRSGGAAAGASAEAPSFSSIDDIVSAIRATPANSNDVQAVLLPSLLKTFHSQKGKGQKIFRKSLQDGVDPLGMLDPAINTLGFTFILGVRSAQCTTQEEARALMPVIAAFARSFDSQQWIGAGDAVATLVRGIVNVARLSEDLVWANPSLLRILDAFRRVQGGLNNLTVIHVVVLYHLLLTAHYETAMDWILQYDIVSADTKVTPLAYSDVLEYFYYGGMICTKVGDLEKGVTLLQQCIATPAQAVSAIQIDAYKKLILLQLMKDGAVSRMPAFASQAVTKAIRGNLSNLEAYHSFIKMYTNEVPLKIGVPDEQDSKKTSKRNLTQNLNEFVQNKQEIFERDQNFGLVQSLVDVYLSRRVARLSKLFAIISIGEIVKLLYIEEDLNVPFEQACKQIFEALQRAQEMQWIKATFKNENTASVEISSAIVHFEQSHIDIANGPETSKRLMSVMKENHYWNKVLQEKERSLAQSEPYLAKLINPSRSGFGTLSMDDFDEDVYV